MPDSSNPIDDAILAERTHANYIENEKQTRKLREKFATWTIGVVNAWIGILVIAFWLLALHKSFYPEVEIFSDFVLVTLLGTSTATILGLPYIILRGLFPSNSPKPSSDPT